MTKGGHDFLLHRTAASELDPISEFSLGVRPRAFSRVSSVYLGAREHRGEALISTSSPQQMSRRPRFARAQSRSKTGDSCLRMIPLALVSRLGCSKSWLRNPCFETYRKNAQKMPMRHPIVVFGLVYCARVQALARESNGAYVPQRQLLPRERERLGNPSPRVRSSKDHRKSTDILKYLGTPRRTDARFEKKRPYFKHH